jgi:cytidyltransferase-like protein
VNNVAQLKEVIRFSKYQQKKGKKVGLVVGSFDIVHLGHLNLFRLAKKHVDFLIIGLDNDKTIKLVKGKSRPINNFRRRSGFLSDLATVDKIFLIGKTSHHDSEEALDNYRKLVEKIKPTHIFTHLVCDKHWKEKKKIAKEHNIVFLADKSKKIMTSGTILKLLTSEL